MNRVILGLLVLVALFPAGCKKATPKELFQVAENRSMQADRVLDSLRAAGGDVNALLQPVIDAYETVVKEYPESQEAEHSLHSIATILNNGMRQPEKAVVAYKRYVEVFPNGPQAANAMFLTGFIYNNELHNLDSARAAYARFLNRFPQSELASSALFELQNLGKSPEELFPQGSPQEEPPATAQQKHKSRLPAGSKTL